MNRRYFIKMGSLAGAALPLGSWLKAGALNRTHGMAGSHGMNEVVDPDNLYELFAAPPSHYRPYVRWWWNGDRVTQQEVLRELDILQDAGIGGVEINPIKWNDNANPIDIPQLQWGTEPWLEVVETAVKGAKERGMVCDMIVGSGWPYGGEFVPMEERSQIIVLGTKNLDPHQNYSFTRKELEDSVTPPSNFKDKQSELFLLRLAPTQMDSFTAGTDLNVLEQIHVKTGDQPQVLYYLVKVTGFQSVIQGAWGAGGPVINHYQKEAVQHYLDHFGGILTSRLGSLNQYFRAFFTDSIELEGANWCADMFEQFQSRHHYDLKPYFPYILHKVGEMGNTVNEAYGSQFSPEVVEVLNQVRFDFETTRTELFQERFIGTFTAWCKAQGVQSRMQAYGMDCHPLEASMLLDIPECETWIWVPEVEEFDDKRSEFGGRNYTNVNKFISSAAHLNGKQLISCEEMTNTGQIFNTTLERIKVTGDQSNLSGVTHSILHGFNYSPIEAPFPGWIRYGTYFNERNTWWPYMRLWTDYKARLSYLFQQGDMQADIAVLHPLADLASKFGYQRDPFPKITYPTYVHYVWEAIHQNGNGCDYLSEHLIQQSTISNGQFHFHNRSYKALVLIEVESMDLATAKAIKRFADSGGKVIFIGKAPHLSPGLLDHQHLSHAVAHTMAPVVKRFGIVPAPGADALAWFKDIQQQYGLTPYVHMDVLAYHISQLHYKVGSSAVFFFVNYSAAKEHRFQAQFNVKGTPFVWDPETGKRFRLTPGSDGTLSIHLGPAATQLIIFEPDPASGASETPTKGISETAGPSDIPVYVSPPTSQPAQWVSPAGPWTVELAHVNGTSRTIQLTELTDLKSRPDTKDFAGTLLYQTASPISVKGSRVFLDLGHINDISVLEINGMPLGTHWYGRHLYDITPALRADAAPNYISIKVVTTLGAYTKSLTGNKAAQEWSDGKLFGPTGLVGPVKIFAES